MVAFSSSAMFMVLMLLSDTSLVLASKLCLLEEEDGSGGWRKLWWECCRKFVGAPVMVDCCLYLSNGVIFISYSYRCWAGSPLYC